MERRRPAPRIASSGRSGERAVRAHPARVRAAVAVERAACGRARAGRATASRPSHRAMTLASRPWSRSSTTTRSPGASRAPAIAACGLGEVVADRHALAGGQAVGLDHDPRAVGVERPRERRAPARTSVERAGARHAARRPPRRPRGRTPCSISIRAAAADRPEDRDPGVDERVGHPGRQRRLGPDDDELGGLAPGERDHGGPVERIDVGSAAHPRLACDRVAPRARRPPR